MRSRIAIVAVLALGVLMMGTGATLAFSGSSGSGDASKAQYNPPGTTGTLGEEEDAAEDTAGVSDDSPAGTSGPEQVTRQEAATGDDGELPFTGLAAIPILLAGAVLLTSGLLLARRSRET